MKLHHKPYFGTWTLKFLLRLAGIMVIPMILCTCATFAPYPVGYFKDCQFNEQNLTTNDINLARKFAIQRAFAYNQVATAQLNQQAWIYDYPLIGIGAAALGAAINGVSATTVSGIGLGAATIAGYRTYSDNRGRASSFSNAQKACECLVFKSSIFVEPLDNDCSGVKSGNNAPCNVIQERIGKVSDMLREARQQHDLPEETQQALDSAIKAAEIARKLGNDALRDIKLAPQEIMTVLL